ncbi:oxaloacetate decarboxylase, gamma chain [Oxobacter pfennigii]|uniref:Oxaloacetate decarboxylase, gamma chain n=1 Tax=Oxobacter pfennigii TaxID=36849 RepID=A0A0P8WRR4_9CLOT|nr:OadG family protein [Oxobacter pfennigii]KPU45283.1 oxaloacetate decarboxylase, gamma chain [Oxobacter pfennigii]
MIYLMTLLNIPFSSDAFKTFNEGLEVMAYGMTTVILVLFMFYIIIKLLIKLFPDREKN